MGADALRKLERLPEPLRRALAGLTPEQRMLLTLKRDLYDRDWRPMIEDLTHRLAGRPHVFRLAGRIEDDLERIAELQRLEAEHDVDLSAYLPPSDPKETPA